MKNKILIWIAIILGIAFFALAIIYWTVNAGSLPSWIPGSNPGTTGIHLKHGIAALLLGLASFAYAWFASGKKSANQ